MPGDGAPDGLVPVPPVELVDRDRRRIDAVQAAYVHVDLVGVGTRHVEGVDPARAAERVARNTGVEGVGRELVLAGDELEPVRRDDPVEDPLLRTDRAVAVARAHELAADAKAHPATVA